MLKSTSALLVMVGLAFSSANARADDQQDITKVQVVETPVPSAAGDVVFGWNRLPVVANAATGQLNDAILVVRKADGTPIPGLKIRLVIGPSPGAFNDPEIENAFVDTDANGTASLQSVVIKGSPRLVYLAAQTLERQQTSPAVPLTVGPMVADQIEIVQRVPEETVNGALLGQPSVRVLAHGAALFGAIVAAVRTGGQGTLVGEVAHTDASGIAVFPELRVVSTCPSQDCGSVSLQFISGTQATSPVKVSVKAPQLSELIPVSSMPNETTSGAALPGFTVRAASATGLDVPGVTVSLRTRSGQLLGEVTTKPNGLALFDGVTFSAPAGPAELVLLAGEVRRPMPMTVRPGAAARIEIIGQPPSRVGYDSIFDPHPRIRVTDGAGNAVASASVRVSACVRKMPSAAESRDSIDKSVPVAATTALALQSAPLCQKLNSFRASLAGTTIRQSGVDGYAEFDDLKYRGVTSEVQLRFELLNGGAGTEAAYSNAFTHDPRTDHDNNIVAVNAIKTISGVAPESEFFDLRFRFRAPLRLHVMANIDMALTAHTSKDSASSPQKRLTEASLLLNSPPLFTNKPASDVPERLFSAGAQFKVFATVPYYGVHVVSMEMGGSPFEGSSLSVAWLRRWYGDKSVAIGEDTIPLARHNVGVDFLIRSSTVDFFKVITIRGSVLVPFDKNVRMVSRIALAIPIGPVIRF